MIGQSTLRCVVVLRAEHLVVPHPTPHKRNEDRLALFSDLCFCRAGAHTKTKLSMAARSRSSSREIAIAQPPTVVRIRRKRGEIVEACDVYIGRHMFQGGWRLRASAWCNPFRIGKDGTRADVLDKYEAYVRRNERLMDNLSSLAGMKLGCWCKPEPCHGDVLVKLFLETCIKQDD